MAPRRIVLFLIRAYQKTLSFDHGPMRRFYPYGYCRFHPTCSDYGYGCIEKYGLLRGGALTAWRVLRCNPFSRGGNDPVPSKTYTPRLNVGAFLCYSQCGVCT